MSTEIPYSKVERNAMDMEHLLDMLQNARQQCGIVGITQKPRDEQAKILQSLMHKFDAEKDKQSVIDSKWGLGDKDAMEE